MIKVIMISFSADAYKQAFENGQTTSVSNFLKTDPKYYQNIVTKVSQALDMTTIGSEIRNCMIILKRK